MLIAAKVLGATCLAGALATSGVLTTDHPAPHHNEPASSTLVSDPHASFQALAEAPTTTMAPPPAVAPVTLPPPVQPTVIPVAGAGTVVIVLQGPVVIVRDVKALPGWIASVERRSGDVNVVFRKGDRSFRFFASMVDKRLSSAIREIRADGDHPVTFDSRRGDFRDHDGDHRDGDGHRDGHH